jgi:hypothetical protein
VHSRGTFFLALIALYVAGYKLWMCCASMVSPADWLQHSVLQ